MRVLVMPAHHDHLHDIKRQIDPLDTAVSFTCTRVLSQRPFDNSKVLIAMAVKSSTTDTFRVDLKEYAKMISMTNKFCIFTGSHGNGCTVKCTPGWEEGGGNDICIYIYIYIYIYQCTSITASLPMLNSNSLLAGRCNLQVSITLLTKSFLGTYHLLYSSTPRHAYQWLWDI